MQNNHHIPTVPSRTISSVKFESELSFIPFIDAPVGSETDLLAPKVQLEFLENYCTPSIQPSPELHRKVESSSDSTLDNNKLTASLNSLNTLPIIKKQAYRMKESKQFRKETKATQTLAIVLGKLFFRDTF